jgi:hypothetical protein
MALLTVSMCGLVLSLLVAPVAVVGLFMGIGIWLPLDFDVNKYALKATLACRGGWDAYAFPWG